MGDVVKNLLSDRRIVWLLLAGLAVQIITAIIAVGGNHTDQHFQIIEFSMYQLGRESGAMHVWEIDHFVRPTLQVYIFSAYYLFCGYMGIDDPFTQLTILRIIQGALLWAVFNMVTAYYCRNLSNKIRYTALLLVNFSWVLPYTRTMFSSEMMSSLFFFGALLLYDAKKDKSPGTLFLSLIGFLFSLSFYFRFQTGFALAAVGLCILFFDKRYRHILPLALGFIAGAAINTWLDYQFYKEWVITPYAYFAANIFDDRAAAFGTSSVLKYIGVLLVTMPIIPASFIFLYYSGKVFPKHFREPVYLSVIVFLVGHSLVGHKEERFLFPVFNIMPVIIALGTVALERYYRSASRFSRGFIKVNLVIAGILNVFLLVLLMVIPYAQTIRFSEKIATYFKGRPEVLYALGQQPFETISHTPMVYYKQAAPGLRQVRINDVDSIRQLKAPLVYVAATYNSIRGNFGMMDSLGYKPVMYSSTFLWNVNEWLDSRGANTVNEIWVLYRKEENIP